MAAPCASVNMKALSLVLLGAACLWLSIPATTQASEFKIESLSQPASIAGAWRFQVGDDPAWAQPGFDDSHWASLMVPRDWRRQGYGDYSGTAWYRITIKFEGDVSQRHDSLDHAGITLGKIHSAYEVYAGGQLLGGVGKLPPEPQIVYDKFAIYPIPLSAIDAAGRVVVAVRVWRPQQSWCCSTAGGAYEGPFMVGKVSQLMGDIGVREIAALVLSVLYGVFGLYHLYLYRRNPQLRQYLWFGLLTVAVGVYTFSISQWKHSVDIPYLLHKKIEYGVLYIMPAIGLEMMWCLLDYRPKRWARAYQLSFVAMMAIVVLVPNFDVHFVTLKIWQVWAMPGILALLVQIIWNAQMANQEARTILVGMAIFTATIMNDIMVNQAVISTPRLASFGFAAIIVSMAVSLANRFTQMFSNLELQVGERTRELSAANERLLEVSRIDVLTRLLNRRGFAERAEGEINRARRSQRGFVLVMADIDRFKSFNDQFGHACGDYVLERVADLLRSQMRDVDLVARWGGEEFILLLPETSLEGGAVLAEKLRQLVEENEFRYGDQDLKLSLTLGVARFEPHMSLDDCLVLADKAMYRGKAAGRNVVEVEGEIHRGSNTSDAIGFRGAF